MKIMRKANIAAAIRDDLIIQATPLVTNDPDADRAWTMEQALQSYKRVRVRLLEYIESRKPTLDVPAEKEGRK